MVNALLKQSVQTCYLPLVLPEFTGNVRLLLGFYITEWTAVLPEFTGDLNWLLRSYISGWTIILPEFTGNIRWLLGCCINNWLPQFIFIVESYFIDIFFLIIGKIKRLLIVSKMNSNTCASSFITQSGVAYEAYHKRSHVGPLSLIDKPFVLSTSCHNYCWQPIYQLRAFLQGLKITIINVSAEAYIIRRRSVANQHWCSKCMTQHDGGHLRLIVYLSFTQVMKCYWSSLII